MKRIVIFTLSLVFCGYLQAQQTVLYENKVYEPNIKSVVFAHRALSTSLPIIDLNSSRSSRLRLTFDDIDGEYRSFLYSVIHCDKDWQPSALDEIEYLDGFNGEEIDNFSFSANGYSEYTNYQLELPNDDLRWIISGNYVLIITDEETGDPVLTRRFMVAENNVRIMPSIIKPTNVTKINTHQEMNIKLDYEGMRISRPLEELTVSIVQNGNWNSALNNVRGTFVLGDQLIFDQFDQITFPALKEFRNFDIRTLQYATEFVNAIERNETETNVLLDLCKRRYDRNFLYEIDANGFFVLDNKDYNDGHVTSEYCNVIFPLESYKKYEEDVYIVGAFSDWQAKEEYRMEYDASRQLYLLEAPFKQGFYDYMYALKTEDGQLDIDAIEGSYYETENYYHILVYYRGYTEEYDRLVGVTSFNSNPRN